MKKYGQDLKSDYNVAERKLNNISNNIMKRFDLIISDYREYISEEQKRYLMICGSSDFTLQEKLKFIIEVEDRYIKENGNQLDLFI
jgi:predicted ATPase with chaperone activity